MLRFTIPVEALAAVCCAAKEDSRYHMTNVLLRREEKRCTLSATDGKILGEHTWEEEGDAGELLVPASFLRDAAKAAKKVRAPWVHVAKKEAELVASTGTPARGYQTLGTSVPAGRFPPVASIRFPFDASGTTVSLGAEVLDRLLDLARAAGGTATLHFSDRERGQVKHGIGFRAGEFEGVFMPVTRDEPVRRPRVHTPAPEPIVEAAAAPLSEPAIAATEKPSETAIARRCVVCAAEGPIHGRGKCKRCYRKAHAAAKAAPAVAAV